MKITENLIKKARKVAKKHYDALQFDEGKRVKLDRDIGGQKEIYGCWVPCVIYLTKNEMPETDFDNE